MAVRQVPLSSNITEVIFLVTDLVFFTSLIVNQWLVSGLIGVVVFRIYRIIVNRSYEWSKIAVMF